jgi:hypothetical protein
MVCRLPLQYTGGNLSARREFVLIVYTVAIFVSAALLFVVQPMFARMVLPLLGGSPSVWNTAMVFYQATLLAGYAYAHATTRWLGIRRQAALHLVVLLLPLLVLPLRIPAGWTPPTDTNPISWLLLLLLVAVGLPFFAVSATSPLLQRWFAGTGHRSANDPYFLYAASNIGSMLALLSYPLLIEPALRLAEQSWIWSIGYGLLIALIGGCAVFLWRAPKAPDAGSLATAVSAKISRTGESSATANTTTERVSWQRRGRWTLLAFVPSSLMLSATTYISADLAAIPLLWVLPLSIYLLTFILVFANKPFPSHTVMVRALPFVLIPLVVVLASGVNRPIIPLIVIHLLGLFMVAMVCHGELAKDRPSTRYLTEFYMWLSVGGMLGGIFNAIIAPLVFTIVAEYPLTMVLACLLSPQLARRTQRPTQLALDVLLPVAIGVLVAQLAIRSSDFGVTSRWGTIALVFGVPAVLCVGFMRRPLRFGLGIGAILLVGAVIAGSGGNILYTERSFFGIHRVGQTTLADGGEYHSLIHGNTLHGMQSLDPARRREPITYYASTGPIGQLFAELGDDLADRPVAVVGLGAGSIACYAQPGQQWTFYEIDPVVEELARDPRYFTFLRDCTPESPVVLGDARLSLEQAPDGRYGMIFLDAYSSDAPPLHLLTREALQLYLRKLAPDGILIFNITNRHLHLETTLGNLAQDAGLVAIVQHNRSIEERDADRGKTPSQWAVLARDTARLSGLLRDTRWQPIRVDPQTAVWTDDYSSLVSALIQR